MGLTLAILFNCQKHEKTKQFECWSRLNAILVLILLNGGEFRELGVQNSTIRVPVFSTCRCQIHNIQHSWGYLSVCMFSATKDCTVSMLIRQSLLIWSQREPIRSNQTQFPPQLGDVSPRCQCHTSSQPSLCKQLGHSYMD